jgi:hypothetical protein
MDLVGIFKLIYNDFYRIAIRNTKNELYSFKHYGIAYSLLKLSYAAIFKNCYCR